MILHRTLPYDPNLRPLPGVQPLRPVDGWIVEDEVFAQQMAERDHLLATQRSAVFGDTGRAEAAKAELLQMIRTILARRPRYDVTATHIRRPDGGRVAMDGDPLITAARLVQEDLVLMQKYGDEHILAAAVLCFPASWSLHEKLGRPLRGIHDPVDEYDSNIARRVQRLFDGIQHGRPLWRHNALRYEDPNLFQPRTENHRRDHDAPCPYLRSEHQSLIRLPQSGAVLFAIHTYQVRVA